MRKYNVNEKERWHTAAHEAGHAFMQHLIGRNFSIAELLPVETEGAIGWSCYNESVSNPFEEIIYRPLVCYAGAQAVNVLIGFEEPSGCQTDYKNADERIKLILHVFAKNSFNHNQIQEIKKTFKSACHNVLRANKDLLNEIAQVLYNDWSSVKISDSKFLNNS